MTNSKITDTTDRVNPSADVASSRAFIKVDPEMANDFLRADVTGIQLIKNDAAFAERSFGKWLREEDSYVTKKSVGAFRPLFKAAPFVPDKGIENPLKDLANRRSVAKEFFGHPELFRDNGPLEKALLRS